MVADRAAARLLLSDADGLDFVLWEDALKGYSVGDDGTIVLADDALQKRLTTIVSYPAGAATDNGTASSEER